MSLWSLEIRLDVLTDTKHHIVFIDEWCRLSIKILEFADFRINAQKKIFKSIINRMRKTKNRSCSDDSVKLH